MSLSTDSKRSVKVSYGVRGLDTKYGGRVDDDIIRTATWKFDYNDLPTYGSTNMEQVIPANARILSAKLEIITAFTSTSTTTDLDIGLYTSAGVAISASGLITAAEATQTTIATAGNVIVGSAGALINKTIGATAGEVVVTPNVADLTAGRARLIVQYITAGV